MAYRYFATRARKFIIADAPGHEQYTRNMVTAAAGSDAAVVLVDITKLDSAQRPVVELLPQTRRHALLAQLLRVPSIVFAVNKLDAVADPAPAYARRARRAAALRRRGRHPRGRHRAGLGAARRQRDAAAARAAGTTARRCCSCWRSLPTTQERNDGAAARCRCSTSPATATAPATSRACCGAASRAAGCASATRCSCFPSGETARVSRAAAPGQRVHASAPAQSAGVVLDRQLDVSRGDWLAAPGSVAAEPHASRHARLARHRAGDDRPQVLAAPRQPLGAGRISAIEHRLDIHTLQPTRRTSSRVNEIGEVIVETQQPLPLARFADNRVAGALIVVDPATHRTSGTLLVRDTEPAA